MVAEKSHYAYIPIRPYTKYLHDNIFRRFSEMKEREFAEDEKRARYLPNLYYIDRLSEEFLLSPTHIRKIINSYIRQ